MRRRRFLGKSAYRTSSPGAEFRSTCSARDKAGCGVDKGSERQVVSILKIVTSSARRRRAHGRLVVLGLFALVTLVAPLLHHDFECHLKSRIHCDACTASPAASRIESGVTLFIHIGPLRPGVPESVEAKARVERPSSPGRAPPLQEISFV